MPTAPEDFFLPELCEAEALFTLVLLAELLVMVMVLAEPLLNGFDWQRLALMSLFVQWNVLLAAGLLCRLRPLLMKIHQALAGVLCGMLVVALTLACTWMADWLGLSQVDGHEEWLVRYLRHGIIALIMSGLVLRYFYLRSQWRRQQQAELKARLASLQARIRPHFLFNSLNSIASLIVIDPFKAEQAVLDLSDLFRASLAQPGTLIAWRDELGLARRYLSIEQYRMGDRLQVEWDLGEMPSWLQIPQLTLQPLLENSIIHGIQPRIEGGLIQVSAHYRDGVFELQVSNPFDPRPDAAPSRGTRHGLQNIEARLTALFGPQARLSVESSDGKYSICLRYPCARPTQEARAS